mmetsp:Transcript_34592/g.33803  ORF Transcript_34592/g.33803 Transcript_34592/m.33803 type:complete len:87 (+) Transcript_34592:765-1025(+)
MSDDTVLIVFGDHGMTNDGNHGGATETELKSVMFAYSKNPFPMKDLNWMDLDDTLGNDAKQIDLASTICTIFNISFPFSNLGVFLP